MTTTNAKVECVPSFWKKWWNVLVNCFKRDAVCTAGKQPTPQAENAKAQEKGAS